MLAVAAIQVSLSLLSLGVEPIGQDLQSFDSLGVGFFGHSTDRLHE